MEIAFLIIRFVLVFHGAKNFVLPREITMFYIGFVKELNYCLRRRVPK